MTSLTLLPTRQQHGNAGRHVPFLKAWRQHVGWSQFQMAARSGVAQRTVQRLEHGGTASPHMVGRLAAALGIDNGALLHRPPHDGEAVTPSTRVRAAISDGDGGVAFYVKPHWYQANDDWGWQPLAVTLATDTGIPAARLAAIQEQEAPASMDEVVAIARAFHTSVLEVITYR